MPIDIITLIILALAIWKGYSRGLIVAIFSFLALLIGLAAALKFSVVVSEWLGDNTHIGSAWLPFLSFIIVMIGVILLVRWIANMIEAAVEIAFLGWLNKLGGIVLYVLLYMMLWSIVLFYLTKMNILKTETITASETYNIIEPWGPMAVDTFAHVIPYFKDMFADLEKFFGNLANHPG